MSEVPDSTTWHDLGPSQGMTFDPGHVVWLGNRRVAVFPLGPGYTAIDDLCPHAGASLGDGWRDGNVIACPLHGWEFDLADGRCPFGDEWRAEVFPVRKVDGRLEVGLPPERE